MRNLLRNRLSSCLIALLMLTAACAKPILVPIPDGGGDGGRPAEVGGAADSGLAPDCPALFPSCSPSTTGICDPVCQTGCNACQKCSYAFNDYLTGQPSCTEAPVAGMKPFDPCTTSSLVRDDVCAPGSICLDLTKMGTAASLCFRLCRTEAECENVGCIKRTIAGSNGPFVCDPPYDSCALAGNCCDPLAGATGAAAPGSKACPLGQFCYLVSPDSGHSRTVCDYTVGGSSIAGVCGASRDCFQKLTCVDGRCRQVCNASTPCVSGTCSKKSPTEEYGYCLG